MMSIAAGSQCFAHSVVNDQPAVLGQNGRSSGANLEPLPGRDWGRQSVMRGKPTEAIWFMVFQDRRTIGNPDALPIKVHFTGRRVASCFLRSSARKEWTMEHA